MKKQMRLSYLVQRSLFVRLFYAFMLIGCTPVIQPPQEFLGSISGHERIPLKIGLIVNRDLCEVQWQESRWIMPIGKWLCRNSEILARHAFSEIVVVNDPTQPRLVNIEAVFTPKIVYMNRTEGATRGGESIIAMKVEWNLSTPHGEPIWIETIGGKANSPSSDSYTEIVLRQVLSDLLLNSQQAIASSEAIKHFAMGLRQ